MHSKAAEALKAELIQENSLLERALFLQCGECAIRVQSNSVELLEKLQQYFSNLVIDQSPADLTVIVIESAALELPYHFKDWPREAGKKGRKDSYYDVEGARLIRKTRTGMVFLQSDNCKIAAGPSLANTNQVINFINSQHMIWLQQRDWLICHAAGVVHKNHSYAIAGFSGGGKSTFMLRLMNDDSIDFLSNDRLFIRHQKTVDAEGIAKLPRINPGTIVNNPRLQALIPEAERNQLLSLPKQQLWDIEEKYDVDIESVYGPGRIAISKPLQAFIVLNWQHNSEHAFDVNKVDLEHRQDLLPAIMKSSGPFYQDTKGQFLTNFNDRNEVRYLQILSQVDIYEVSGQIDFDALDRYFHQNIIT